MIRPAETAAALARVPVLWRAILLGLVLCGLLLALVESRARILRSGQEIRLRTVPVDPRDLFRGDYVVLSYAIGMVTAEGDDWRRGDGVFVRLAKDAEGFAQAVGASRSRPQAAAGEVVIAGRVVSASRCRPGQAGASDCAEGSRRLRIAYGLESYFVPQGTGRPIETADKARIEIVAAVSASGEAAIKRLLIDGRLVHAEPPY